MRTQWFYVSIVYYSIILFISHNPGYAEGMWYGVHRAIEIVHDLIESENKDMKDYLSNNLLARMSMEKV